MTPLEVAMHLTKALIEKSSLPQTGMDTAKMREDMHTNAEAIGQAYQAIYTAVTTAPAQHPEERP